MANHRSWWVAAIISFGIVGAFLTWGTLTILDQLHTADAQNRRMVLDARRQQHTIEANVDRIQALTHATEDANYRICYRQMVVRAVVNSTANESHTHDERTMPLYDCQPNLTGGTARRLTPQQARRFERHVRTTPVNQLP